MRISDLCINITHVGNLDKTITGGTGTTWGKWLIANATSDDVILHKIQPLMGNGGRFYLGKTLLSQADFAAVGFSDQPFVDVHDLSTLPGVYFDNAIGSPSTMPEAVTDEIHLADNQFYPLFPRIELPRVQEYDGVLKYATAVLIVQIDTAGADADTVFTAGIEVIRR